MTAARPARMSFGMKPDRPLKRGWTTGACATAAAKSAYTALLTGTFEDPVTIALPRGERVAFALARQELTPVSATAAIVKDAGDDPDVTHGALVEATVRKSDGGLRFRAGPGVGTVTKPGLPIGPGEPAINPMPRQMIADAIAEVADRHGGSGDVEVEISIPGGEKLAEKTMNGRLGIVGGLSILGTTGIVVPYSCAAWIHSIYSGIDVARATGLTHIAGATGATLRGGGPAPLRIAGKCADRYGRFRRRYAETPAQASRAPGHHRRRRREDDQAGPGNARPAFGQGRSRPGCACPGRRRSRGERQGGRRNCRRQHDGARLPGCRGPKGWRSETRSPLRRSAKPRLSSPERTSGSTC